MMATADHIPDVMSELSKAVMDAKRDITYCTQYALTLTSVLSQMNVQESARILNVAFNTNGIEGHTLVELFNESESVWMLLDPTFAASAKRASDGKWATAEDIRSATLAGDWSRISYEFLDAQSDSRFRGYYLDYPLLFINLFRWTDPFVLGEGTSPMPYLSSVSLPLAGPAEDYLLKCDTGTDATLIWDGAVQTLPCDGIDLLSRIITATSLEIQSESPVTFTTYKPMRFVF